MPRWDLLSDGDSSQAALGAVVVGLKVSVFAVPAQGSAVRGRIGEHLTPLRVLLSYGRSAYELARETAINDGMADAAGGLCGFDQSM